PSATTSGGTPPPAEARRRSPWMWPLIAIVSLLAVALIAIIIVIAVQPNGTEPDPTTPPPTSPTTAPTTPSATPTSNTVPIDPAEYVGLPLDDAIAKLNALEAGFQIETAEGSVAPSPGQIGTVQRISPVGNVRRDQTITLTFSRAPGTPAKPAKPTPSATTGDAGDGIELTFGYAQCPAGFELQGFTFTLENAEPVGGTLELPAGATTLTITLTNPGSTATASFTAKCAGGLTSPASDPVEITVNP